MDISPELLIASIGLLIISFLSTQPPQEVDIDSIETSDIGEKVTVTGNISKTYSTQEISFINIKDKTGEIKGVAFNNMPALEGFSSVTGRVDLYKGQLQLIVNDVSPGFERSISNKK